jgi:hypothetical protein
MDQTVGLFIVDAIALACSEPRHKHPNKNLKEETNRCHRTEDGLVIFHADIQSQNERAGTKCSGLFHLPWRSGVKSKHSGPSEVICSRSAGPGGGFPRQRATKLSLSIRLAAPGVEMNQGEIVYSEYIYKLYPESSVQ